VNWGGAIHPLPVGKRGVGGKGGPLYLVRSGPVRSRLHGARNSRRLRRGVPTRTQVSPLPYDFAQTRGRPSSEHHNPFSYPNGMEDNRPCWGEELLVNRKDPILLQKLKAVWCNGSAAERSGLVGLRSERLLKESARGTSNLADGPTEFPCALCQPFPSQRALRFCKLRLILR
jgi:hypothetical protein